MKVGDVVRLSEIGLAEKWWPSWRSQQPSNLRGDVVRVARTGTVSVRWRGWKTPQVYQDGRMSGLEVTHG